MRKGEQVHIRPTPEIELTSDIVETRLQALRQLHKFAAQIQETLVLPPGMGLSLPQSPSGRKYGDSKGRDGGVGG